jgi:hypothetical protein
MPARWDWLQFIAFVILLGCMIAFMALGDALK